MANSECKQIEKHIKDILFKSQVPDEPVSQPNRNINPFSIDDRCLVSNIENIPNPPNSGKSELIDFNVLTNFAAQHIDGLPFVSPLVLNSKELVLPHPDLEDDARNGEVDPGISGLLNSITKEIQNSPHFLSMPENPIGQVIWIFFLLFSILEIKGQGADSRQRAF